MVASNFTLPENMKFGEAQIIAIIVYSVMLVVGLIANSTFLYHLLCERLAKRNKNRMSLLLIHLSVADLIVSFLISLLGNYILHIYTFMIINTHS